MTREVETALRSNRDRVVRVTRTLVYEGKAGEVYRVLNMSLCQDIGVAQSPGGVATVMTAESLERLP